MEGLKTVTHGDVIDSESVSIEEAVAAGSPAAAPVARTQADLDKKYVLPQHQTTGLQAIVGAVPVLNKPPQQVSQPTTASSPVQEVETAPIGILDKDVQEARAEIDRIMTESKANREVVEASMVAMKADNPPLEKYQQVKPVSVGGFSADTIKFEAELKRIDNTPESIAKREADIAAKEGKGKNSIPATPDVQANNTALETAQGEGSGNEQQKEVAPEKGFFARFFGKKENSDNTPQPKPVDEPELSSADISKAVGYLDRLDDPGERPRIEAIETRLKNHPIVGESIFGLKNNPRVDTVTRTLLDQMVEMLPKGHKRNIETGYMNTSVYGVQHLLNEDWNNVRGFKNVANNFCVGGAGAFAGLVGYATLASGVAAAIPTITIVGPAVLAILAVRGIYMANIYMKKKKGEGIIQKLFTKKT